MFGDIYNSHPAAIYTDDGEAANIGSSATSDAAAIGVVEY